MKSGFQLESAKTPQSKEISDALAAALPQKQARLSKISFHSCLETEPMTVRKRKRKYLPWWVIFVAYLLVVLIALVCSFLTVLYTLSYGYYKSMRWLTAFLLSFVYDLFIGQPLKVIALAIFFSLIFKKADIECPDDLELSEGDHKDLEFAKYVEEMRAANPLYRPPPSSLLVSARRQKEMTRKMYAIVIEIVRYVLFMYLVLLITYSQRNPKIYWLNKFLLQTFNVDALKLMSNKIEFWNWAKSDLIQAIYDDEDPNYLPNKFSYILGTPTFRQLRLRTDSGCSSPKTLDRTKCTETFSRSKEERGDFVLGWNQSVDQTGVILTSLEVNGPWLYSTQSESGGTTWSGVVADYGSGGYVANFSKTPDSAILLLNELYSREWIDNFTSAVVFELYAFAPNVNLLSEVTFLVEFPPFGGLIVSKSISSIKLYHYISGMHLFALILEAIFIVYTVYFLIREAESIMREREQYFTNVWNIFDMATVVVSVASVVLFIVNYLESSVTVELYGSTRSVRFHKMFQVGNLIDFVMGMLICLGMIKFLHLLRFNPLIYKFGYVFRSLGTKILMFCLVLLCVMIAFSGLLFLLTRGQVRPFKSMTKCLETHFRALLGFFDYDPVRDFDSIWIPTLYIGYSFVATFCLYSLMIAMFLDGLNEVSRRLLPNEETALLWILIGKIKDWFGIKEHQTGKERPAEGKDPKWLEPKESFSDQTTSQARVTTSAATETGADASTLKGTNTASEGVQGTSAQSSLAQGADTATGAIQDTRTESSQGKTIDNASLRGTTYDALKSTSTTSDGPASTGAVQGTSPLQGSKTKSSAVQDARSSPAEDQHKTMPAKKDTTDSASNQQAPK